jgi:protein ImuB
MFSEKQTILPLLKEKQRLKALRSMFAVIHVPDFSLQSVLRYEPELRSRAVALIDPEQPKPNVVQINSLAQQCGVVEGSTASQAMARCSELIIKTRSRTCEQAATEVLLQTAYAFSPAIEDSAPGVCTMELKGLPVAAVCDSRSDDHRASLQDWSAKILRALKQFYLDACIGFGVPPELALLAARSSADKRCNVAVPAAGSRTVSVRKSDGETSLKPAGEDACATIASLPISALEPSPEISEILRSWGIRTVGEFLALGKNEVAERLGTAALELFARVSNDSVRPLKLVSPPEIFSEQTEFENEIETTEPLLFVLRRFTEQLSRRLELIYLVVAELHLELGLSSGTKYERVFRIPSPTGQIETLFRTLQTHLETVRTDSPITSLRLTAKPCKPESHQFGLFESTLCDPNQFAETLARITALCGSERVGTPQLNATNRPDSFHMVVPEFDSASIQNSKLRTENSGLHLRRFRPALTAYMEFRDEKPALIRSEIFNGAVADSRGPFCSSGNWWDTNIWAREEWDVQTSDGLLLRIFRSSDGCFVEGVYD